MVFSDMFHITAIKMLSDPLRETVADERSGRDGISLGQNVAEMGFSNVGLDVDHAMAHTLSAHYGTPHGIAYEIFLPTAMEFNKEYSGEKYREIARTMSVFDMDAMTQEGYRQVAIDAVKKLSEDVGIPQTLEGIVKEKDNPALAQSAHEDACPPGNPRESSVEDIIGLYKCLL